MCLKIFLQYHCLTQSSLPPFFPADTRAAIEAWPEVEQAEGLARGAALKWASGVFCHPEHLERLSQYKKRESQRINSVHTRLKVRSQKTFINIHKTSIYSICRNQEIFLE